MGKITYSKIGLKVNTEVNKFTFNNQEIEVLHYLPVEDKIDLIEVALQKAEEDGIYNETMLDMYFHLNMVYLYSNITFTEKQKENEPKLYDAMVSSGFMAAFLQAMDEDEYNAVFNDLQRVRASREKYDLSTAAIVKSLIVDLPENAKTAAAVVDGFDPAQFQRLLNFAKASGFEDNKPATANSKPSIVKATKS